MTTADPGPAAGGRPDPLGRAGRGRLAPVQGGLRAVHQQMLRSFAATGQPPDAAALDAAAVGWARTAQEILADLHEEDFLRLDDAGQVRAAYPFSAVPTPHLVQIEKGPQVYAMCAVDALGIAAMLGAGTRITSADPHTGEPVTVTVQAGGQQARWEPAAAVVFAGRVAPGRCAGPGPVIAAGVSCGHTSLFTSWPGAAAWARAHPQVTGQILEQAAALQLGTQIFGPVLRGAE